MILGYKFIKVLSLDPARIVHSIPSSDYNFRGAVTSDEKTLLVASGSGLLTFSLPDLISLEKFERPGEIYSLHIMNRLGRVFLSDRKKLVSVCLSSWLATEYPDSHLSNISDIESTFDERYLFTTGSDCALKKWDVEGLSMAKSVSLPSSGSSLLVADEQESVLVGMRMGEIYQFSIEDLSLLRKIKMGTSEVKRIIRTANRQVAAINGNGILHFPFVDSKGIRTFSNAISFSPMSNGRVACVYKEGVKVIDVPLEVSLLPAIPYPSTKDPHEPVLSSISSSVRSIRSSSSAYKPQLICLLQHHLSQLLSDVQPQPSRFSGLALSLTPDLRSLRRSHTHSQTTAGRSRVFNSEYFLETSSSNPSGSSLEASLVLFKRKLRLYGKVTDRENPLHGFKVSAVKRGKSLFEMNRETLLGRDELYGAATAKFMNGSLSCTISEGLVLARGPDQINFEFNGERCVVSSIGSDMMLETSDRKKYFLNFETQRIEDLLM